MRVVMRVCFCFQWLCLVGGSSLVVESHMGLAMATPICTVEQSGAKPKGTASEADLLFSDDFSGSLDAWAFSDPASWEVVKNDGNAVLLNNKNISDYNPTYRSPHNIALVKDIEAESFELTFKVKSNKDTGAHRDCCVFFGYQNPDQFYYVHLGAKPDPASGQIMLVDNAPRSPLTKNETPVPWGNDWHLVKLIRNVTTGEVAIYFDDMHKPIMQVVDKTFGKGQVGIGSFDDMNSFDDVRIKKLQVDEPAKKPKAEPKAKVVQRPTPTVANYRYGDDSERQVMDFWKAESEVSTPLVVMIHGGGWRSGDKENYDRKSINPYLKQGISVAAINYRFIEEAMEQGITPPVKAPIDDAVRAIQTLRRKATEWNIDPNRIALTGSSAGACTSLWIALHEDLADANSSDPIARHSSRVLCAAVTGAQTSLDPVQLREWIGNSVYGGHAFGFAAKGRERPEEFQLLLENREEVLPWIREYSPIELLSPDDPPIYLEYPRQEGVPALEGIEKDPTHSAMYGIQFQNRCSELGVKCDLVYPALDSPKFKNSREFLINALKN